MNIFMRIDSNNIGACKSTVDKYKRKIKEK
jgi:hypothetical protein